MFIFEDLPKLEGRSLQILLREVENADLALSLKAAGEEIKKAVFENLSETAAAQDSEEMLNNLPPSAPAGCRRHIFSPRPRLGLRSYRGRLGHALFRYGPGSGPFAAAQD